MRDAQRYMEWLAAYQGKHGRTIQPATQRKYLNSLSNLYRRAEGEGLVRHNPVRSLMEKPQDRSTQTESNWLEVDEAALLLESARLYVPEREKVAMPFMYELVAAFLLTGGRTKEVLGLTVQDISFARSTVRFRPNRWRGLKTRGSDRSVPLWPQLEEILQPYVSPSEERSGDDLLFPSIRTGGMITDIRKALDQIGAAVGYPEGSIRSYAFRHTYAAARLQTLDQGQPVAPYTVGVEMGHGGSSLVQRVYGHLGAVRHRSEHVEFRVDQHEDALSQKLKEVREHWQKMRASLS